MLNPKTGKLELQRPVGASGALADALDSGLYAGEIETSSRDLMVDVHDIEVKHRVYRGLEGERMLDITVKNHAATREALKLTCAVYVDGSTEAKYLSLPLYENAVSSRRAQTITLPVSALVDDPAAHSRARVEITAVGKNERAYAHNEFIVQLGGTDALHFTREPEDEAVQEGEDVSFTVEVAGGAKPYQYRWEVYNPDKGKWTTLEGFTDSTISREKIEKKWNGAIFRCVVTDAAGAQITSRGATLTVRDKVPTGDGSSLPLYLAIAAAAMILLVLLRRKAKKV